MTSESNNSPLSPLAGIVLKPGIKWLPFQREQATGVVERGGLEDDERIKLIRSAAEILGSGADPRKTAARSTGLVVGYVQSGKTLSFTTVIGLARDNGFPLVIVVAGTKDPLLSQSHERLRKDLNVDDADGLVPWIMEKNPRTQGSQYEQLLRRTIANWRDKSLEDDEKPTLLLTVLKQNHRLRSLTELLQRLDLSDVPTLIVDDEADQASLNTKVGKGEESTTYSRLRELRDALPFHTLLQYTATPQAPLLINIADTLSPDYVHVLEPGLGYVGGQEFFTSGSLYVQPIPPGDVPQRNALPLEPPTSLLQALKAFYVGLAVSKIDGRGRLSMLIHPARETVVHQAYARWASATKDAWEATLKQASTDPDRKELIEQFRIAYNNIATTETSLPTFDQVVEKLAYALRNTAVIEFNTRGTPKTPEIKWKNAVGWILVGGQALDRGFTVERLSVTYMPRGVGVGNADTIQQRARFFGYKRKYLGLCRIYLALDLRTAFESYVEHEQTMRTELRLLAEQGAALQSWRRRLILDPSLQPCRKSVISDPITRLRRRGGWTLQRGALMNSATLKVNGELVDKFLFGLQMQTDSSYVSNEPAQQHQVCQNAPMQKIIDLFAEYRCEDPRDTASFTGLLVTISEALRRENSLVASVYQMRPRAKGFREIKEDGSIDFYLQGKTDKAGAYPGDNFFSMPDRLSVQVHNFELRRKGRVEANEARLLVFHVPAQIARDWLIQIQSGQQ
jgi:hypothetical protein